MDNSQTRKVANLNIFQWNSRSLIPKIKSFEQLLNRDSMYTCGGYFGDLVGFRYPFEGK